FGRDLYTEKNILISGTHTHSTPGGTGGTVLVDLTTLGFVKQNWEACVNGIVQSIMRAHNNLQLGRIKINIGQVDNCNINRSPASYLNNIDREQYKYNTDHEMTVLRFESIDGKNEIGMMNFFPVHAVSLNSSNLLVAGDNKGYASYLFEKSKNPQGTLPGQGKFVAAFGQSNEGDVSPNLNGPKCIDTGLPCEFYTSTCDGRNEKCIGSGPGNTTYESNEIIGKIQFEAAKVLYDNAQLYINGIANFRHIYINMQTINVSSHYTSTGRNETTCQAALGYAFAAGATDGHGDFDFKQSTNSTNPFWQYLSSFIATPTPEQIQCQAPKPILLDVGQTKPIEWVPFILPLQIFQIGQLIIVAVPGEFTTMSGRRLKSTIKQAFQDAGTWTPYSHIVIAGLANSYAHYITTYEEYQQQRYEGGSTLYGPHTLAAYQQLFYDLANNLARNQSVPSGAQPFDIRGRTISFLPPPLWDSVPIGKKFGDVITDVASSYKPGDTVRCSWWGANPRNDLFTEKSFLYVDQLVNEKWVPILTDDDLETRFRWERQSIDHSIITVEWNIPTTQPTGHYRIRHQGVKHNAAGREQYNAQSKIFTITK
ncbi:unnamed protein product, partial [Rotaria sp. Silwood2]